MPGLRVDFRETQGLFSKYARANRYAQISAVGSRSGGLDRIGRRSNRDRWAQIGGLWEFGRGAAAGLAGDHLPWRRIAGFGQSGAPGVNSTRIWGLGWTSRYA